MPPERRLLLVGAGHAHLHLLRHASRLDAAGYRTTLVAPARFDYSGAASGIAAGGRDPAEGRIDVAALARHGPVDHRAGRVTDVDLTTRTATTDDGTRLDWDLVSFNIGSVVDVPPVATGDATVVEVKPLSSLARLRERLEHPPTGRGHHLTVVGGGASGLELAAHLAARADTDRVHLLEYGPRIGDFLPHRAARRLVGLLEGRGVRIVTDAGPVRVDGDALVLRGGTRLAHDILVVATGLAPPPLATRSPLGGRDGFPVRATLQHRDHDDVYAAGDCADFLPMSLPRLGVHGVRQGPVLLAAFEARATGAPAPVYRPQEHVLSILDLGGGTALAVRGRWWWLGRSSLALKRRIDRRWLATYRS
ncbi:pyridine nucleotide-disulfide oxidoreductase [Nocardioides flavus (ex Wang et al. 2016)]|uniref:Pyridine nucleotide-disulfide oxidoreductase n=1 Tax=Nocardioides flavus (ex Wang et al. 2016) TaxID=2058780 RepID=A0ABQ3HT12_9ACTN|nr:FAD-dependent oxidoreductase [Nocardioides flavus (ex Wang et al. 2016)]GHE18960.1 pyridine nucleotide-disulfide oxidoreductase [Nocardioides flavus (ex Wang et al. 2016)]